MIRIGRRRCIVDAVWIRAVPLELRSAVAARLEHPRARGRYVPAQPVDAGGAGVTAAADIAADRVVGPPPVDAGGGNVAVVQRVDPLLPPVAECGVEGPEGEVRAAAHA